MTCQTEQQDLVTPIQELAPGALYRVKGNNNSWKYGLIINQTSDKKEVKVLSPKRNITKMTIEDMNWLVKEMNISFEIVQ